MKAPIRIGIAEDHVLFRQGLIALLKDYKDIEILFEANNGREVMEHLKLERPHILLLDIEMPVMNGDVVLSKIKQRYRSVKVIVVSQHARDVYMMELIKKGARAFLSKYSDIEKIVEAIREVHESGYYLEAAVSEAMVKFISNKSAPAPEIIEFPGVKLSERELQVLELICRGQSSSEIAEQLCISKKTVDNHRFNLMKRTKTKNAQALTNYALRHHLVKV